MWIGSSRPGDRLPESYTGVTEITATKTPITATCNTANLELLEALSEVTKTAVTASPKTASLQIVGEGTATATKTSVTATPNTVNTEIITQISKTQITVTPKTANVELIPITVTKTQVTATIKQVTTSITTTVTKPQATATTKTASSIAIFTATKTQVTATPLEAYKLRYSVATKTPIIAYSKTGIYALNRSKKVRLRVYHDDGSYEDLTDRIKSGPKLTQNIDNYDKMVRMRFDNHISYVNKGESLDPTDEGSKLNRDNSDNFDPILSEFHEVTLEVDTGAGYWELVYEGWAGGRTHTKAVQTLRDEITFRPYGKLLPIKELEVNTTKTYTSVDFVELIRTILSDNGFTGEFGNIKVVDDPGETVSSYTVEEGQTVWREILGLMELTDYKLATQYWDSGTAFNDGTGESTSEDGFYLTLFDPDRSKTTPDYSFTRPYKERRLTYDIDEVKTGVRVKYRDDNLSKLYETDWTFDTDAKNNYGIPNGNESKLHRRLTLQLDNTSPINTVAEANDLRDRVLHDVKRPDPTSTIKIDRAYIRPQLHDLVLFNWDKKVIIGVTYIETDYSPDNLQGTTRLKGSYDRVIGERNRWLQYSPSTEENIRRTQDDLDRTIVEDYSDNIESISIGDKIIGIVFKQPDPDWNKFDHYKLYYDVDTGSGWSGTWNLIHEGRGPGKVHKNLTTSYIYKYKLTFVTQDGSETTGTISDNGGAGYQPNASDNSNIVSESLIAQMIVGTEEVRADHLVTNTAVITDTLQIQDGIITAAKISADLGNVTIRQDTAPTQRPNGDALEEGDIWIDTNDGDKPYSYTGSSWIQSYTQIDGGHITTGSIDADLVTAGTLDFNAISRSGLQIIQSEISNGAVDTDQLDTYSVSHDKLQANAVHTINLYIDDDVCFNADGNYHCVNEVDKVVNGNNWIEFSGYDLVLNSSGSIQFNDNIQIQGDINSVTNISVSQHITIGNYLSMGGYIDLNNNNLKGIPYTGTTMWGNLPNEEGNLIFYNNAGQLCYIPYQT